MVQRVQIVTLELLEHEVLSEHQISIKIKVSETAVHQAIKKFHLYNLYKDLKKN